MQKFGQAWIKFKKKKTEEEIKLDFPTTVALPL